MQTRLFPVVDPAMNQGLFRGDFLTHMNIKMFLRKQAQ